ncbi:MAG TPA: putative Ig domain-containing protein [Mycobacteriales bacterium]|nr:putative Ig domain-containing protein [Mycobacteriales bacterium]
MRGVPARRAAVLASAVALGSLWPASVGAASAHDGKSAAVPKTAATVLAYGAQQTLIGPALTSPNGLAISTSGNIFVTDGKTNRALELRAGSSTAKQLAFTGLSDPTGIGVDSAGDVFVVDSGHGRVLELAHDATKQTVLPLHGITSPVGLAVDPDGDVVVTDFNTGRVAELRHGTSHDTLLGFNKLTNPQAVAISHGNVYVANTGGNQVVELKKGKSSQTVLPFGALSAPQSVAVDGSGDVFVAGAEISELAAGSNQVTTLPLSGTPAQALAVDSNGNLFAASTSLYEYVGHKAPATAVPSFGLYTAKAVAVDPKGDAFVADYDSSGNARLVELPVGASTPTVLMSDGLHQPQGVAIQASGKSWQSVWVTNVRYDQLVSLANGANTGNILVTTVAHPRGVAVDSAGNAFIVDNAKNHVLELPSGSSTLTTMPFTGMASPTGVALDSAGDLFAVDTGNDRVLELAKGASTPKTLPFVGLSGPTGIAVDSSGDVFVADTGNNRVLELAHGSSSPKVLPFIGLRHPQSVAVDSAKNVFVVDSGNSRLLKLPLVPATAPKFSADHPGAKARAGALYYYTFHATGTPRPTYSIAKGALPRGIRLDAGTGELTGTPGVGGRYTFRVRARNSLGSVLSPSLHIVVSEAPVFAAEHPRRHMTVGKHYAYQFIALGYPIARYVLFSGKLPKGMHLNHDTGVLSGKPTKPGKYRFKVRASNGVKPRAYTHRITIKVTG